MFSGIVENLGTVVGIRPAPARTAEATRLEIEMGALLEGLPLGASVAVNGVCLTLAERHGTVGGFDAVPETLRRTNLQYLKQGGLVHLERSLRIGDRLDGHFVQGHVDGMGALDAIERQRGEYKLWLTVPPELTPYMVRKGSVALDGVSLTLVDAADGRISVVLIPTTLERTTLGQRRPGDFINIESDILARLVIHRLEALRAVDGGTANLLENGGVTWDQLRESGYLR